MPLEPTHKRAITFVDGQNLYRCVKDVFGYSYPNYDVIKLSTEICNHEGWNLQQVRFYTGIPAHADDQRWKKFWDKKLAIMGRRGVVLYKRELRYHEKTMTIPDYGEYTYLVGREKGIDIRIALDAIRLFREDKYDVILIFSQDQDFTKVVKELNVMANERNRWLKVASAFPYSPYTGNSRGINDTHWIKINRELYDTCIDTRDYR